MQPTGFEKIMLCEKYSPAQILAQDAERIKAMPYKRFLRTAYWRIVSSHVMEAAGYRCSQCRAKTELQVHHLTYEHHGREHVHLEDLVALCKPCHASKHGHAMPLSVFAIFIQCIDQMRSGKPQSKDARLLAQVGMTLP